MGKKTPGRFRVRRIQPGSATCPTTAEPYRTPPTMIKLIQYPGPPCWGKDGDRVLRDLTEVLGAEGFERTFGGG